MSLRKVAQELLLSLHAKHPPGESYFNGRARHWEGRMSMLVSPAVEGSSSDIYISMGMDFEDSLHSQGLNKFEPSNGMVCFCANCRYSREQCSI